MSGLYQELAESLARRKQAELDAAAAPPANPGVPVSRKRQPKPAPAKTQTVGDLWKDVDEDDFFGAAKPAQAEEDDDAEDEPMEETGKKGQSRDEGRVLDRGAVPDAALENPSVGRGKAAGGAAKPRKTRGPNKRKKGETAGDGF